MRLRTLSSILLAAVAGVAFSAVPQGYYSSLEGKCGSELKTAAKLVAKQGFTAVTYNTGTWKAFLETDTREVNGELCWWDMYSPDAVSVASGHPGMNIEHSVANSWWGGAKNNAYKDLFHLNPSNADANNWKSNYPLGIVVEVKVNKNGVVYDNGYTMVGKPAAGDCGGAPWVYEPCDEFKGDFARVFFYMFTVYDDIAWMADASDRNYMFDGTAYPSLRPWAYRMLLEWAELDPVSQKEIDRNEAVARIQKNRNPFIDNPDLPKHIWGDLRDTPFSVSGTPTEVEDIDVAGDDEEMVFDLCGRRVDPDRLSPGIYIRAGRKVIVR